MSAWRRSGYDVTVTWTVKLDPTIMVAFNRLCVSDSLPASTADCVILPNIIIVINIIIIIIIIIIVIIIVIVGVVSVIIIGLMTSFVEPISQLRFDYNTTTIRRYQDAFDYDGSDRNYDLRSIRLRCDYDTITTKKWHVHFFLLASNRVEWKQARAIRRNRIVVGSQL